MVKETVRVYARVKPLGRRQQAGIYSVDDDEASVSSLEIIVPRDLADGFVNNKRESYKFKFQKIFDQEAKQDVVFDSIAKPVAECALAGYNGTIFAYGQTGSGKTFTITGGAERYSDRGIIPRTLSYIFHQLQKDSSKVYTTHVSYLEIYNECGYDLLDPRHEASRLEDLPKVTIMEDPDQNIHLKNLSLQQATNEEEALNLLFLGDTNRMIAEVAQKICTQEIPKSIEYMTQVVAAASRKAHANGEVFVCSEDLKSASVVNDVTEFLEEISSFLNNRKINLLQQTRITYETLEKFYVPEIFMEGNVQQTPMNQASTRSHCIFTIHISSKEPGSATIRRSKLHLVDLAGSERVAKTGVGGHLLTEAKYINLSLHYLEQVIIALAEKNRSHIPYRNSMMTSVLRDSLGGNCMTTMIATLSLDKRNIGESISTCRFAQRVALIKNEAVLNEEIDPRLMIAQLKKEIQELKDELALVTGEQRTAELSQEELLRLEELIERFLEDNDPESILDVGPDMRKIKYCFIHVKQLMNHSKISEKKLLSQHISEEKDTNIQAGKEELKKLKELLQQRDNEIDILVNMLKKEKKKTQDALFQLNAVSGGSKVLEQSLSINLEESQSPSSCVNLKEARGFSCSVLRLPFLSRQTGHVPMPLPKQIAAPPPAIKMLEVPASEPMSDTSREGGEMSPGCQEAFEVFKRDHADSITIEDNKQLLKQRPSERRDNPAAHSKVSFRYTNLWAAHLAHKHDPCFHHQWIPREMCSRFLERAAFRVEDAVASPSEELNKFDPVEEKLRAQIEEEKKSYKTMFNRLKGLKVEIEHLQLLMEKAKVKLQKDFELWWSEEATKLQQEKPELVNTSNTAAVYPQFIKSLQHLSTNSSSETRRISPNEDSTGNKSSITFSYPTSKSRTLPSSSSSIPLTGDSQIDADILAFIKARENILQKKGLGNK